MRKYLFGREILIDYWQSDSHSIFSVHLYKRFDFGGILVFIQRNSVFKYHSSIQILTLIYMGREN